MSFRKTEREGHYKLLLLLLLLLYLFFPPPRPLSAVHWFGGFSYLLCFETCVKFDCCEHPFTPSCTPGLGRDVHMRLSSLLLPRVGWSSAISLPCEMAARLSISVCTPSLTLHLCWFAQFSASRTNTSPPSISFSPSASLCCHRHP